MTTVVFIILRNMQFVTNMKILSPYVTDVITRIRNDKTGGTGLKMTVKNKPCYGADVSLKKRSTFCLNISTQRKDKNFQDSKRRQREEEGKGRTGGGRRRRRGVLGQMGEETHTSSPVSEGK